MENNKLELEIREINQKLDFIAEQMREYRTHQKEIEELKDDLSLIAKDMFNAAVDELEDVAPYFDSADIVHLGKKLLRNTRNLNKMLTQVEGVADLWRDIEPLGKQAFDELLNTLDELDKKGYFEFFTESLKIVDTVITTFNAEDVRLLRENIATILMTVKDMTQPEMLSSVNNALGFFKKMDVIVKEDISMFSLMKQLRDPEVKRGIAFSLEFIKRMANTGNNQN